MRILVTGGAGYIGSHTVQHLLGHGHAVTVVDNLSQGHRAAVPRGELVVMDLKDTGALDHLLLSRRIEAVVHFAADAQVGESVINPAKYYRNNLLTSLGLLECCRRNGVGKFVFSSTCATYGTPEVVPITESTPQRPINPYGNTKLAFEVALSDYAQAYDFGFCALRYFNASGAAGDGSLGEDHAPESHLIPIVISAAMGRRESVTVFGTDYDTPDGTCVRDYIHVEDLALAHRLALEVLQPHDARKYNVGTGQGYSVREVIRTVEDVGGKPVKVVVGERRPGDPPVLVAAGDAIRGELGWEPKWPELRGIVQSAWDWHARHPKGYAKG